MILQRHKFIQQDSNDEWTRNITSFVFFMVAFICSFNISWNKYDFFQEPFIQRSVLLFIISSLPKRRRLQNHLTKMSSKLIRRVNIVFSVLIIESLLFVVEALIVSLAKSQETLQIIYVYSHNSEYRKPPVCFSHLKNYESDDVWMSSSSSPPPSSSSICAVSMQYLGNHGFTRNRSIT